MENAVFGSGVFDFETGHVELFFGWWCSVIKVKIPHKLAGFKISSL